MSNTLEEYSYQCGVDGHGLAYPGFSVVMIQIFSFDYTRKFALLLILSNYIRRAYARFKRFILR